MTYSEKIVFFHEHNVEHVLRFEIYYSLHSGDAMSIRGSVKSATLKKADEIRNGILRNMTDSVLKNWFMIEVSTPLRDDMGNEITSQPCLKIVRQEAQRMMI